MIDFRYDEDAGIVRVTGTGRWSAAEVDLHFAKLALLLKALRLQGLPVRILGDVTAAEIQTPEIEARINAHSERTYLPGDRIALVVKTNLLKVHVRDASSSDELALFCSAAAAETWLVAHDQKMSA